MLLPAAMGVYVPPITPASHHLCLHTSRHHLKGMSQALRVYNILSRLLLASGVDFFTNEAARLSVETVTHSIHVLVSRMLRP